MRKLAILAIFLALTLLVSGCTQPAQGNAVQYKATIEKINAEFAQVEQYMKNVNTKLASANADDMSTVLTSTSNDLQDAKFHVQNAQSLAHDLSGYATNAQEQQDAQKVLTHLQYLENSLSSLNSAIEEVQKPSPDFIVFEAKIKESNDWLSKIK